jgi:hypothetical protein
MRALLYIKHHHPTSTFESALHYLFHLFWAPPNPDLTTVEAVAKALAEVPKDFKGVGIGEGQGRLFTSEEVKAIMEGAASEKIKAGLKAKTQEALDKGCFGAPWMWVFDEGRGKGEPFFGSDR